MPLPGATSSFFGSVFHDVPCIPFRSAQKIAKELRQGIEVFKGLFPFLKCFANAAWCRYCQSLFAKQPNIDAISSLGAHGFVWFAVFACLKNKQESTRLGCIWTILNTTCLHTKLYSLELRSQCWTDTGKRCSIEWVTAPRSRPFMATTTRKSHCRWCWTTISMNSPRILRSCPQLRQNSMAWRKPWETWRLGMDLQLHLGGFGHVWADDRYQSVPFIHIAYTIIYPWPIYESQSI